MTNEHILESVICLLAIDGDVHKAEMQFFRDLCGRLNVSKESAETILNKARQGKGRIYLPEKDADKKRLIYFLVQAVVADKHVTQSEMKALNAVVEKLGLSATDVAQFVHRQLEEIKRPPQITCPKCGYEQPQAHECRRCGIVFERYKQAQAPEDSDVEKLRKLLSPTQTLKGNSA